MPTVAQILNARERAPRADYHLYATVVAVSGTTATVAMEPGGERTTAANPPGATTGQSVLLLIASIGNYILAVLPTATAAATDEGS